MAEQTELTGGLPDYNKMTQEAYQKLLDSLDNRQNNRQLLLAASEGFLTPTRTGSFGESLGQVAGNVRKVQEEQQKQDLSNASLRLQLAQGLKGLAGQQAFNRLIGGQPPTPAQVGMPSGAPTGAPTVATQPADKGTRKLGMADVLNFASAYPENKELINLLKDSVKYESDRFKIAMNGTVFDTHTGQYITQLPPGQTPSQYYVPETGGNVLMTPGQYADYQSARNKGVGKQWVNDFMSAEPKTEEKPVIRTQADVEAEKAAKEVSEREKAKSESERYNTAVNRGEDSGDRLRMYTTLQQIASRPDAKKIFGVFENGKFSDALFKYLESNKGLISANDIRNIWTDVGLDPKLITDKQLAVSLIAQQAFAFSSLAKGQGAISDFERSLFNSMGADIKDRPETIIKKMEMLSERAKFDKRVSQLARNARKNGVSYDDFKDSEPYLKAYDSYMNTLMNIVNPKGGGASPSGQPSANPARDQLRKELGF